MAAEVWLMNAGEGKLFFAEGRTLSPFHHTSHFILMSQAFPLPGVFFHGTVNVSANRV